MRALLLLTAAAGALLFPWSSAFSPQPAPMTGSRTVEAGTTLARQHPAVRLSASFGIMPLADDERDDAPAALTDPGERPSWLSNRDDDAVVSSAAGHSSIPAGVRCENGVCRLPDRMVPPAPTPMPDPAPESPRGALFGAGSESTARPVFTWEEAQQRLRERGITEFRLETSDEPGIFHFCCSVPSHQLGAEVQRFEATAVSDMAAVTRVLEQIESLGPVKK
jgi:hypothetical protein